MVIKNIVNNFSCSFNGLISPKPTVDTVITVMYSAFTNEYPDITIYPNTPIIKTKIRSNNALRNFDLNIDIYISCFYLETEVSCSFNY